LAAILKSDMLAPSGIRPRSSPRVVVRRFGTYGSSDRRISSTANLMICRKIDQAIPPHLRHGSRAAKRLALRPLGDGSDTRKE